MSATQGSDCNQNRSLLAKPLLVRADTKLRIVKALTLLGGTHGEICPVRKQAQLGFHATFFRTVIAFGQQVDQQIRVVDHPVRRCRLVHRFDHPAEDRSVRIAVKRTGISLQPAWIQFHVVIRPADIVAFRRSHASVACIRQPCLGLPYATQGQTVGKCLDHCRRIVGTAVINDNHFPGRIVGLAKGNEAVQHMMQLPGTISGAHDDGYQHL